MRVLEYRQSIEVSVDQLAGTQTSTRMVRVHQRFPSIRLMLAARRKLDDGIDLLRLKLDALPDGIYQPVPGIHVRRAKRSVGTGSRWAAMEPVVERLGVESALDVGANVGYFPIMLARRGIPSVALESDPKYVRTATTAVRRNQLDNVAVMSLEFRPDTLALLRRPTAPFCCPSGITWCGSWVSTPPPTCCEGSGPGPAR